MQLFVSPTRAVLRAISLLIAGAVPSAAGQPMDSAIAYQGELANFGTPAAGTHDLRFQLFDAQSDGAQVGTTLCADNVEVSNGRFVVSLDFGPVFAGQKRFLEIQVRADSGLDCTDDTGYTTQEDPHRVRLASEASFQVPGYLERALSRAFLPLVCKQRVLV